MIVNKILSLNLFSLSRFLLVGATSAALISVNHFVVACCVLTCGTFGRFKTVLDIDSNGTFNVTRAAFDALCDAEGAVVINISATLHYGARHYQLAASAAKYGHFLSREIPFPLFVSLLPLLSSAPAF